MAATEIARFLLSTDRTYSVPSIETALVAIESGKARRGSGTRVLQALGLSPHYEAVWQQRCGAGSQKLRAAELQLISLHLCFVTVIQWDQRGTPTLLTLKELVKQTSR